MNPIDHSQSYTWTLGAAVLGTMAGLATRKIMAEAWEASQDTPPPVNPVADDVTWRDALAWAAISGVTVAMARVVAKRSVARAWERKEQRGTESWTQAEVI